MTERLYDTDSYLKSFRARVLSCEKTAGGYRTVLDKTAFFPTQGGQTCDTGSIAGARVTDVFIDGDGVITHLTDAPVQGECECELDFNERLYKMRCHTAEHILCGVIHRLYGYENVGFHLGSDEVTFDVGGTLNGMDLDEVERQANAAVLKNLPVFAYYPDGFKLYNMEYRSKGKITGPVRIVEIEGVDICACCAPHVARTGEIGLIKITSAENYKRGARLHMLCGMDALADYQQKQKNLDKIAAALSSRPNEAAEHFDRFADEAGALRRRLSELRHDALFYKMNTIRRTDGSILLFEQNVDMGTIRLMMNLLEGRYGTECAIFSGSDDGGYNFAVTSEVRSPGDIAELMRRRFSAKCGGGSIVQGFVKATRAQLEEFFK